MLQDDIDQAYLKQEVHYPVHTNYASRLGHPCLRYLVHARRDWDKKAKLPPQALRRMRRGKALEEHAIHEMMVGGRNIICQQEPFVWPDKQIAGRIDGKFQMGRETQPFEIKTTTPYAFRKLNTVDDFRRKWWTLNYICQMTLYLLMADKEKGQLILFEPVDWELKEIEVPLDYSLGEQLVQKAETINAWMGKDGYPDAEECDACERCEFAHLCPQGERPKDAEIILDRQDLEEKLARREVLKSQVAEYNDLEKELKEGFRGKTLVVVGDWKIAGKMATRKGYTVQGGDYWTTKITKLPKGE